MLRNHAGRAGRGPGQRAHRAGPRGEPAAGRAAAAGPTPGEVPAGLVPLLSASGPRDQSAIAAFSADPAAAVADLTAHGFKHAYVAQYAEAGGARVVSVVVVRFGDEAGAVADLTGDLAAGSGEVLALPLVGDAPAGAQARRQPLPGQAVGELVTVRFRRGATTWLLAYGDRPSADPQVALRLARLLTDRTT